MNAHDVMQYKQLIPADLASTYKDYVAARFALHIGLYNPGWQTSQVHCPIVFAICGKDTVAPPSPSLHYAQNAPRATVKLYPEMGHFDIYLGEHFDKSTRDYQEFLKQNL